jgi:hypothetical protein
LQRKRSIGARRRRQIDLGRRALERVGDGGVGHLARVLDAAPAQHQHVRALGPPGDLRQQRALADPGLAEDGEHPAVARARLANRSRRRLELEIAPNQPHHPP